MKHLIFCLAALVAAMIPNSATASVTLYNSESGFLAAAPAVTTETFDEFPKNTSWSSSLVVSDGVRYQTQYGGWSLNRFFGTHTAPNALSTFQGEYTQISFGQGKRVTAFGFWMGVPSVSFQIHDVLNVVEIDGRQTELQLMPPSGSMTYWGFTSDVGIREINIRDWPNDSVGANWSYDNVSHSAIVLPEPSAPISLLCGILATCRLARRRRSG